MLSSHTTRTKNLQWPSWPAFAAASEELQSESFGAWLTSHRNLLVDVPILSYNLGMLCVADRHAVSTTAHSEEYTMVAYAAGVNPAAAFANIHGGFNHRGHT